MANSRCCRAASAAPEVRRDYPERPVAGVAVAILRAESVLLVQRAKPPGLGQWQLPGGAIELGETALAAAMRELREETGISIAPTALRLRAHHDVIRRDAAKNLEYHYILLVFCGLDPGGVAIAGSDAAACDFIRFEQVQAIGVPLETREIIAACQAQSRASATRG